MNFQKSACLSLSLTILITAAGCQAPASRTAVPSERTPVTMLYSLPLPQFEALVEETYPDIDLQVEATTMATINGDSERRLRNGHGTDLVVTTMPTGAVKDALMDLSAEAFVENYQATTMNPVMIEGQTRYLPLPGQYTAYILNKTLMEKLGRQLPETNQDILAMFDAGKQQQLGIGEDGSMFGLFVVDPAYVGTYIIGTQIPDFLGNMEGIKWMADFEKKNARFAGEWDDRLDTLLTLVDRGYLNSNALALTKTNVIPIVDRMLDNTLLLSYGNVRLLTQLNRMSEENEYVMLPFLSDSGNQPWVISSPDAYIAVNGSLETEGRQDVLEAALRVLDLLSTQRGQDAWIQDTSATISYLNGYQSDSQTVPPGLENCVEGGYMYNLQMPSNIIQYFGKNMISVLDGKEEMADALAAVDQYWLNGSEEIDYDQSVVGSVSEDLLYENYNTRLEETALGNLVADAVAAYSGADLAVVNGGGIRASLYAGDVLGADLMAVCPYDNTIIVVEAKGSVISQMLENGISQTLRSDNIPGGRFLQVSGLHYTYRPMTAERPAELLEVTLADGSQLQPEHMYTLAINNYMAGSSGYLDNNGDGYTMLNLYSDTVPIASDITLLRETTATYRDALKTYFYNHRNEKITARLEGRITVIKEAR